MRGEPGERSEGIAVGRELIAGEEAAGVRLDRYLAEHAGLPSRAAAERLIERGAVRVDGERAPSRCGSPAAS